MARNKSTPNANSKAPKQTPAANDSSSKEALLTSVAEGKINFRDLVRLFWIMDYSAWLLVIGLLGGAATVGRWTVDGDAEDTAVRAKPKHLNFASVYQASDAQERFSWLVPTFSFLEDEVAAELAAGTWMDAVPVAFESEPMSHSTPAFKVSLAFMPGGLSGYAYRIYRVKETSHPLYQQLATTKASSGEPVFHVPPLDKGDALLFVVKLHSDSALDSDSKTLIKQVSISIQGE